MLSNRQLKVGEEVKRSLSQIISRDIYIDALEGSYITLSKVIMTPDLGIADVYILPMLDSTVSEQKVVDVMNKMAPKIRHILAKKIFLKKLPKLRFQIDKSFDEAARIEILLKR
jgi:ribosome-binding factor A